MSLNLDPPPKSIIFQEWIRWLVNLYEKRGRIENCHEVGATGEPAFENLWVNFDTTRKARFYKDPFGVVHLAGLIKTGTIGTTAFTLPAGYIPDYTSGNSRIFAVSSSSLFGHVLVSDIGKVVPGVGSSTWVSLDGISFRAAE